MFTHDNLRALLNTRPFVPFRLILSDGGALEVPSPEVVLPSGRFAIVGLLDPKTEHNFFDRWTVVWYMHVSRVEQRAPGAPPLTSSPGPETPSPGLKIRFGIIPSQ